MPDTVQSVLHILTHLILTVTLSGRDLLLHFTDIEAEEQKGHGCCSRSHSKGWSVRAGPELPMMFEKNGTMRQHMKGLSTWILGHRLPGINYCNTSKDSKIFNLKCLFRILLNITIRLISFLISHSQ